MKVTNRTSTGAPGSEKDLGDTHVVSHSKDASGRIDGAVMQSPKGTVNLTSDEIHEVGRFYSTNKDNMAPVKNAEAIRAAERKAESEARK